MSQLPSEADELQQAMRQVRVDIRHDVQELVAGARDMADWTSYVRAYPWLCMGAALAAGYLIVPQRTRTMHPSLESRADENTQSQRRSMFAGLLETAASSLLQGGVAILTKQLTQALDNSSRPQPASSPKGAPP